MTTLTFNSDADVRRWDMLRMRRDAKQQMVVRILWRPGQIMCTVVTISDYRFIRFLQIWWYKIKYRK